MREHLDAWKALFRDAYDLVRVRPWMIIWPAVLIWRFTTTAEERDVYIECALAEARSSRK